jgi:thiaminase/transcriptional activator TenA
MKKGAELPFSDQARRRNEARIAAILEHPFNRELAAGTLARESFTFYIAQDSHYLQAFSRALAGVAARAPTAAAREVLLRLASDGVDHERQLHASFGVDGSIPAGPACTAYGDFLLAAAAWSEHAVALGALLPCYSVYAEVAGTIARAATPDNPYSCWIATYDGAAFAKDTDDIVALADEAASGAGGSLRSAMLAAYDRSVAHEWMFCDAAYSCRGWPL